MITKLVSARLTVLKKKWSWTDRPTNGPTDGWADGRTKSLIEMLGRI